VKRIRLILPFVFVVALLAPALGQTKGRITGRVTDEATGEPLIGVNVLLKGTYYGGATDPDGVYVISEINPGDYTLQATMIGFTMVQQTGIKVVPGEILEIDIQMTEAVLQLDKEVVIVGERPLFDIQQASSAQTIQSDQIQAAPVVNVQQIVARQVGITQTAEGIYVRGGRAYETGYYIDGVSAKDPLAGTGFGVDVNPSSIKEVEVITGGIGVEYGATSGIVNVRTQEGTDQIRAAVIYKRDHLGFNSNDPSSFNTDIGEFTISGPVVPGMVNFFGSFPGYFSDEFTRAPAKQLISPTVGESRYAPRQDNRWSGMLKLTARPFVGNKIQVSYRRSLNINQNTRMLQIGGNDVVLAPGYQYPFALQPDNANTYTHDSHLGYLKVTQTLGTDAFVDFQLSRLFTSLRADANGRPWRPDSITQELNAASIISWPISYWRYSDFDSLIYVIQGDPFTAGLYNNGGIAPLWHDHFADEYTFKVDVTYFPSQVHKLRAGLEAKFQEYQWIDINRPWVGAPLKPGDPPRSLGSSFDIWHVWPAQGALYAQDQITFKGLIAYLGLRFQYWFPGKFVDDVMTDPGAIKTPDNPQGIISPSFQQQYFDESFQLGDRYWKGRLLPRIRVSFPVSDNQVLYFNYGHSISWPNAYQVYSGLDLKRQDRSYLARVGNPALRPETTVEYEIGLRNQFSTNDVFTVSAFSKDKFDYVVRRYLAEIDKTTYVNEDYARINGIEVSYIKRIGKWFVGSAGGSYQVAKGKSNSAEASFFRYSDEETTKEKFLAWDRPVQIKLSGNFVIDDDRGLFDISVLNQMRLYLQWNFQSGKRYTPYDSIGIDNTTGRVTYREDLSQEYQLIGESWNWLDLTFQKWFTIGPTRFTLFLEVTNILNAKNSTIINPLTGRAYELGDPTAFRDPTDPHPTDRGIPPFDPARYLQQRHFVAGISISL
jgi:outer membrane receptor protein involved in Fe transport